MRRAHFRDRRVLCCERQAGWDEGIVGFQGGSVPLGEVELRHRFIVATSRSHRSWMFGRPIHSRNRESQVDASHQLCSYAAVVFTARSIRLVSPSAFPVLTNLRVFLQLNFDEMGFQECAGSDGRAPIPNSRAVGLSVPRLEARVWIPSSLLRGAVPATHHFYRSRQIPRLPHPEIPPRLQAHYSRSRTLPCHRYR